MIHEKEFIMENSKPWYKSKTVWSGIVAIGVAAYNAASANFGVPPIPEFVFMMLGALGVYGRTTASTKLGK